MGVLLSAGIKTRNQIREDTILLNFPLYCPKCKRETLIKAKYLKVTVIDNRDKLNIVWNGDANFGL